MTRPVYFLPSLAQARVGQVVTLDGAEAHHAARVRRTQVGERIDLADNSGKRATATVQAVGLGQGATLSVVVDQLIDEAAPPVELILIQALIKGGRDEDAVDTATQLGADRIIPWQAERCVAQWRGPKAQRGQERWSARAAAAAKQSRRARIPAVEPIITTAQLVELLTNLDDDGDLALMLHEEAITPIAHIPLPQAGRLFVIVGPEGGIGEADQLTQAGAQPVHLGHGVLRAELAGTVALGHLGERTGRWA